MSKRILERPAYTLSSYVGPAGTGSHIQFELKTHHGYIGLDREEVNILAQALLRFLGETMDIDPFGLRLKEIPEATVLPAIDWVADLTEQCLSVGVAVFHKESLRHLILDELVRREKP